MKKIGMLIALLTFTLAGFSQANSQQAGKPMRDAQTKADAGKADVIITKKKNLYDSTTFQKDTPKIASKKVVRTRVKTKQPWKANATKKKL